MSSLWMFDDDNEVEKTTLIDNPPPYSILNTIDKTKMKVADWSFVGSFLDVYQPPEDCRFHTILLIQDVRRGLKTHIIDVLGESIIAHAVFRLHNITVVMVRTADHSSANAALRDVVHNCVEPSITTEIVDDAFGQVLAYEGLWPPQFRELDNAHASGLALAAISPKVRRAVSAITTTVSSTLGFKSVGSMIGAPLGGFGAAIGSSMGKSIDDSLRSDEGGEEKNWETKKIYGLLKEGIITFDQARTLLFDAQKR